MINKGELSVVWGVVLLWVNAELLVVYVIN